MSINKGFPASNTIGAGVYVTEKDFSHIPVSTSTHAIGLVGFATKGPINVPTTVTSLRELHTIFGFPHPESSDPYLVYAAEQLLAVTNTVTIVRAGDDATVSPDAAETANKDVFAAGGQVKILGNVAGPFTFVNDTYFRWRLNGVLASKVLVVLADTYTTDELATTLNDQLTGTIDGIEFFATSGTDVLGVRSTFSFGTVSSIELVSVKSAIYGPSSLVGMGTLMEKAVVTGTLTKYPTTASAGEYDLSTFDNLYLDVVVDGTNNANIDNVVQKIAISNSDQTITDIVSAINTQITGGSIPGGFVASNSSNSLRLTTNHAGRDAKITVKTTSTVGTYLGLSGANDKGASPTGISNQITDTTYEAGIVTGSTNSSDDVSLTIYADSPGTEGNLTQVIIANNIRKGTFDLQVFNDGVQVETFGGLTKDQSSAYYAETYLINKSNFIRIVDNTDITAPPANGTYTLVNGTNGIPEDADEQDDLLIGNDIAGTGLQALSNTEIVNIDLVAVPGHSSTSVISELLLFAQQKRSDCIAIIDPPFGLTAEEVVQWHNGVHPLNTSRFDSDFGALYWPWVKIRDTHNKIDVWVPPSGAVLTAYVNTDNQAYPWFPPAGETYGKLFNVSDIYERPSGAQRNLLYGNGNAVNPITTFINGTGFIIFGQKTLQRPETILNRIAPRRMLLLLEKNIQAKSRALLFQPHDEILRAQITKMVTKECEFIKKNRGMYDYRVKCDAELNPTEVVERGEVRIKVGVQPVVNAEFFFYEFSVHRPGTFSESA